MIIYLNVIYWVLFLIFANYYMQELKVYVQCRSRSIPKMLFHTLGEGRGSIPDQSMWDILWTKWRWDWFFSQYLGFPYQ
jgi:hypothetical protein